MKNHYDNAWHKIKKQVAIKNKEITLLWNCGIQQRKYAKKHKITKYTDPKLTPNKLGFIEDSTKHNILNSI